MPTAEQLANALLLLLTIFTMLGLGAIKLFLLWLWWLIDILPG